MESLKRRMVQWEFNNLGLLHVEPQLKHGERRIIMVFQDESLFYANEYKQNIWCAPG
jgi:hypothetical protein